MRASQHRNQFSHHRLRFRLRSRAPRVPHDPVKRPPGRLRDFEILIGHHRFQRLHCGRSHCLCVLPRRAANSVVLALNLLNEIADRVCTESRSGLCIHCLRCDEANATNFFLHRAMHDGCRLLSAAPFTGNMDAAAACSTSCSPGHHRPPLAVPHPKPVSDPKSSRDSPGCRVSPSGAQFRYPPLVANASREYS